MHGGQNELLIVLDDLFQFKVLPTNGSPTLTASRIRSTWILLPVNAIMINIITDSLTLSYPATTTTTLDEEDRDPMRQMKISSTAVATTRVRKHYDLCEIENQDRSIETDDVVYIATRHTMHRSKSANNEIIVCKTGLKLAAAFRTFM